MAEKLQRSYYDSEATRLLQCPICQDVYQKPRSLPCLHTYCFECLNAMWFNAQPGEVVECPTCRAPCNIPQKGVDGFVHNFFIQELIYGDRTTAAHSEHVCEGCAFDDETLEAVNYCSDCNLKLCDKCTRRCVRGGKHQVKRLTTGVAADDTVASAQGACRKHTSQSFVLYCFDCHVNICLMCYAVEHRQHECEEIDRAADRLVIQMKSDIKSVTERLDEIINQQKESKSAFGDVSTNFTALREAIDARYDDIIAVVSDQKQQLLQQLRTVKAVAEKRAKQADEQHNSPLKAMRNFCDRTQELIKSGQPYEITSAAYDLHATARKVLRTRAVTEDNQFALDYYSFIPTDLSELLSAPPEDLNIVGQIQKLDDEQKWDPQANEDFLSSLKSAKIRYQRELSQQKAAPNDEVERLNDELARKELEISQLNVTIRAKDELNKEQLNNIEQQTDQLEQNCDMVEEKETESQQFKHRIDDLEKQLDEANDQLQEKDQQLTKQDRTLEQLERKVNELTAILLARDDILKAKESKISTLKNEVRAMDREIKVRDEKLEKKDLEIAKHKDQLLERSNEFELRMQMTTGELLHTLKQQQKKMNKLLEAGGLAVARVITASDCRFGNVAALTVHGNELFMVRSLTTSHRIEVYDLSNFTFVRYIQLNELSDMAHGLTACDTNKCLYVSDFNKQSVYKVELFGNNNAFTWKVSGVPQGLSVNSRSNLLVTCWGQREQKPDFCFAINQYKLIEYTTSGQVVREILLEDEVTYPQHAIQLNNDQFLISCGGSLNRVIIVDANGRIQLSYKSKPSSASGKSNDTLKHSRHLALDRSSGLIYVADTEHGKISVLDSVLSLKWSRDLKASLERPSALYIDERCNQLFVGEFRGPDSRVVVVDI